jgi:hypothetical protein
MLQRALLILAVTLAIAPFASSQTSFITFEGLADGQVVGNHYVMLDPGVSFGSELRARIDSDAGGTGTFENEPSPSTVGYCDPLADPGARSGVLGMFTGFFAPWLRPVRSLYLHYTALAPINITIGRWPLPDVDLLVDGPYDTDGGLDDWFAIGYDAGAPVIRDLFLDSDLAYAIDNLSFSYDLVPELRGQLIPESRSLLFLLCGLLPFACLARRRSHR